MTQIKTSPPSVTVLQPLSIQHETRVRLPLPESIYVAVTVKPVRATAKNRLETAQPLSTLIQKGLGSIVKRYRTVFVALRRARWDCQNCHKCQNCHNWLIANHFTVCCLVILKIVA